MKKANQHGVFFNQPNPFYKNRPLSKTYYTHVAHIFGIKTSISTLRSPSFLASTGWASSKRLGSFMTWPWERGVEWKEKEDEFTRCSTTCYMWSKKVARRVHLRTVRLSAQAAHAHATKITYKRHPPTYNACVMYIPCFRSTLLSELVFLVQILYLHSIITIGASESTAVAGKPMRCQNDDRCRKPNKHSGRCRPDGPEVGIPFYSSPLSFFKIPLPLI